MSDVNWTCDENGKANSSEQFYETVAYVAQRLRDGGASVCLSLDWARTTARTIVSGLASEGFGPEISKTHAQLISNQAVRMGLLANLIADAYDEDSGLSVWLDPKYADIVTAAKLAVETEREEEGGD